VVVSGEGQDKAVTNAIIQWSGVGVDIGGRSPGIENIRNSVEKVLSRTSYKKKAEAMGQSFARYDISTVVDTVIQDAVRDWAALRH
jgi:UDP:flavonoid glycosyltransferase YjiC (YdhE family)